MWCRLDTEMKPAMSYVCDRHKPGEQWIVGDFIGTICSEYLLEGIRREFAFSLWAVSDKVYAEGITALNQMYCGVERNR